MGSMTQQTQQTQHTEYIYDHQKSESSSALVEADDLSLQPTCAMPVVEPDDITLQETCAMPVALSDEDTALLPVSRPLEQDIRRWQFKMPFNRRATTLQVLADAKPATFHHRQEDSFEYDWSIALAPTMLMPIPSAMGDISLTPTLLMPVPAPTKEHISEEAQAVDSVETLRTLLKSSGIYALASVATPVITLALSPFLARHLSPSAYGAFTIINTFVSLVAGVTQLGLGSAFFRAYNYDYQTEKDRRDVLATITTLLAIVSIVTALLMFLGASWLAKTLLDSSALSNIMYLGAIIVLLQNLAVPGFAWLRAENKPLLYSLLSIGNLLVSLITNLVLIGMFSAGLMGAVIGIGSGYAFVTLCLLPVIIIHAGIKIRVDIARNVLSFGVPMVLSVVSYWALQVLDRYLLNIFGSLAQTSEYAVAYSLGSAISIVVISPFTLAWASAMFTIAKRKDAARVFQTVFRLLAYFLLFSAFGLSLVGKFLLYWLFPPVYHTAAFVIPIVAASLTFYGLYYIVNVGLNIKRKTWISSVFSTIAAITNLILNLVLIPRYGAMGAAIATLLAYIVLVLVAYIVNQRMYPLPLEIGKFALAFVLGAVLYWGSDVLSTSYSGGMSMAISVTTCLLYGAILALAGLLPLWHKRTFAEIDRRVS